MIPVSRNWCCRCERWIGNCTHPLWPSTLSFSPWILARRNLPTNTWWSNPADWTNPPSPSREWTPSIAVFFNYLHSPSLSCFPPNFPQLFSCGPWPPAVSGRTCWQSKASGHLWRLLSLTLALTVSWIALARVILSWSAVSVVVIPLPRTAWRWLQRRRHRHLGDRASQTCALWFALRDHRPTHPRSGWMRRRWNWSIQVLLFCSPTRPLSTCSGCTRWRASRNFRRGALRVHTLRCLLAPGI